MKEKCSKLKSVETNGISTSSNKARNGRQMSKNKPEFEECSLLVAFFTFVSYGVIILVGYIKEFFYPPSMDEKNRKGYVPLYVGFESFYTRNVFRRIRECWNNPICSVPGYEVEIVERYTPDYGFTIRHTGRKKCINVASYNYLGFAENTGPCHDAAMETVNSLGLATCSSPLELGTLSIHRRLESLVAEFLGVDAALTVGMGFATNVLSLPSLVGPNCLVFSDEFNHASLILGLRLSGATVKVFRHNDCEDLERQLRHHIIHGHHRTRRAWSKVFFVVEGIYSMEGTICDLPRLIELKKKYKAYLYLDEAHSIGCLGSHGRGVADYYNCDPKDVDILMGTFTKSFGAAGGYIAGEKSLINHLRMKSDAQHYASSMSPPVVQQVITSMSIIMGKEGGGDGFKRLQQLARNVLYFRRHVNQMGFIIYGSPDSPVVPLSMFLITKVIVMVKELTKRGIAGVGVGFPATKITGGRMRFCLSASHTKEMLDKIIEALREIGDIVGVKYSSKAIKHETFEW